MFDMLAGAQLAASGVASEQAEPFERSGTGLRSPVRMAFARRVLQPDSVRTVRSAANLENLEVGTAS